MGMPAPDPRKAMSRADSSSGRRSTESCVVTKRELSVKCTRPLVLWSVNSGAILSEEP